MSFCVILYFNVPSGTVVILPMEVLQQWCFHCPIFAHVQLLQP